METPGCSVQDEEYPSLTRVGARFNAETGDSFAAEGFEVHFVGCITGEVSRGAAGGVNAVFEVGAFFGYCADLFLGLG